jgi:hypothetical protein
LFLPLFLGLIDENIYPFLLLGYGLSLAGFLLTFLSLPESPQYLFAVENFLDCQESLNCIARFNGVSQKIDLTTLHK